MASRSLAGQRGMLALRIAVLSLVLLLRDGSNPALAATIPPLCLEQHGSFQVINDLTFAKAELNHGRPKTSKAAAQRAARFAIICAASGYERDTYDYAHAAAVVLEGQARLALGDAFGAVLMQRAADEATAIAKRPGIDPDVRQMARNVAYGAALELQTLKTAKKGQLFTPPPTAPP